MLYTQGAEDEFVILPAQGDLSLIPEERSYVIELTGYEKEAAGSVQVFAGDKAVKPQKVTYEAWKKAVVMELPKISVQQELKVTIASKYQAAKNSVEERCFDFLNQAEIDFCLKDELYKMILNEKDVSVLVSELHAMDLDPDLYGVLMEYLTAR